MINNKIHYKYGIEFKGTIVSFNEKLQKYRIRITEWIGKGYPHLEYHLTEEEIRTRSSVG